MKRKILSTTTTLSTLTTTSSQYWADMNISTPACTSVDPPPHLALNKLFSSKRECCEVMLSWMEVGACLDDDDDDETEGDSVTEDSEGVSNEDEEVDCTKLSRSECLETPQCERSSQKMNGLWLNFCTNIQTTSSSTTSDVEAVEISRPVRPLQFQSGNYEGDEEGDSNSSSDETDAPTLSPTPETTEGQPTEWPTGFPSGTPTWSPITEVETESPSSSVVNATAVPTDQPTSPSTASTDRPTHRPTKPEPELYCAFSMADLEAECSSAIRCNHGSCPSGMFCFPFECMVAQSAQDSQADETADPQESPTDSPQSVPTSSPVTAAPSTTSPSYSPAIGPTTDHPSTSPTSSPTSTPTLSPSKAPTSPSTTPTQSPTARYSTSDFIVELLTWANTNTNALNEHPLTYAPTPHPTSLPTTHPTHHPTSTSPTVHPTHPPIPTMELILPSVGETSISSSRPQDNFGSLEAIAINGGNVNSNSDRFDSLLKFDLSLLDSSYDSLNVVEGRLELFALNSCQGGGNVYLSSTEWIEDGVVWNDAPSAQGVKIATLDAQVSKQWISLEISQALSIWRHEYANASLDRTIGLRIMSGVDSLCMFASKESGEDLQPRLVVRYTTGSSIQAMSSDYGDGYDASFGYDVPTATTTSTTTTSSTTEAPHIQPSSKQARPVQVQSTSDQILLATADASLSNIRSDENFGTQNAIVVDGGDYNSGMIRGANEESEQFDVLLKFDVSNINPGEVESSMLRLHVTKGCEYGGNVYATQGGDWDQESVTWDDAPTILGAAIGSLDTVVAREWYSVDLGTTLIYSGDTLTLRISSTFNSRCMYTSIDRGEETAPRLIVKVKSITTSMVYDETQLQQPTQNLIPTTGNFILIVATDDATIDATSPNLNQNDSHILNVDYNEQTRTIRDSIIKFNLSQMGGTLPQSALLTLYTETSCTNAGTFMTTSDTSWSESSVTWTTAPNYQNTNTYEGGSLIGTFGRVDADRWYGFNILQALTEAILMRREEVTVRLTSGGMESCSFSSLQGGRPAKILVAF